MTPTQTASLNGNGRTELVAIGKRFRTARKQAGHTQDWMAKQLDVMPRTVQRWEKGETDPGILMTIKWASNCETTVEWLACGTTDIPAMGLSAIERIADQLAAQSATLRAATSSQEGQ